jgi:hypothetical protein
VKARVLIVAAGALVGIGLGALSGRILFGGSAWNLIPWALVAIAIGLVARDLRTAVVASAVYGYLLCAAFLFVANAGDVSLGQKIGFALALGVVGLVCAVALAVPTFLISRRARRSTPRARSRSIDTAPPQ